MFAYDCSSWSELQFSSNANHLVLGLALAGLRASSSTDYPHFTCQPQVGFPQLVLFF